MLIHINKNIISNDKSNLSDTNKRRMQVLSFYKFREKINIISKKYKSNVKLINEYMTSKLCHNCENIHNNLGSKKIYKCKKCKIEIDRDINASINIYKKGFL